MDQNINQNSSDQAVNQQDGIQAERVLATMKAQEALDWHQDLETISKPENWSQMTAQGPYLQSILDLF